MHPNRDNPESIFIGLITPLLILACAAGPVFAESKPTVGASTAAVAAPPVSNRSREADFAVKIVQKALSYKRGDHASLWDAKGDFTKQAWEEFLRPMNGHLGAKGDPQNNSAFAPIGEPFDKGKDQDGFRVAVPGILNFESKDEKKGYVVTPYTVVADVWVVGKFSKKVGRLKLRPCSPTSKETPCE
jgi:hypothetical protein